MITYEGIRLKINKAIRRNPLLTDHRKKKLKGTDFTIISNNCWGGMIYESYNIIKSSPTVGLFFMSLDYIRFLSHLKYYTSCPIEFISPDQSKWNNSELLLSDKRFGTYPIGRLSFGDETVEIFFLHYHSEEEAYQKWNRRCQRINWNHLLVKFNDQNGMTQEDLDTFLKLPYKKIFFTCRSWNNMNDCCYIIHQPKCYASITASHEPFGHNKYIDIESFINELYI